MNNLSPDDLRSLRASVRYKFVTRGQGTIAARHLLTTSLPHVTSREIIDLVALWLVGGTSFAGWSGRSVSFKSKDPFNVTVANALSWVMTYVDSKSSTKKLAPTDHLKALYYALCRKDLVPDDVREIAGGY
jgi:hypothetical protein